MFVKTVCNYAGSFLTPVPSGLYATIVYNKDGNLSEIRKGHVNFSDIRKDSCTLRLIRCKGIPNKISLCGGTTLVQGVFLADDVGNVSGRLPECIEDAYMQKLEASDTSSLKFIAVNVASMAASFAGSQAIRNWLTVCRFDIIDGFVIPVNMNKQYLFNMIERTTKKFGYLVPSCYCIHSGKNVIFLDAEVKQLYVRNIQYDICEDGYIVATVSDNDTTAVIDGALLKKFGTCIGDILFIDKDNTPFLSKRGSIRQTTSDAVCPICGAREIIRDGKLECEDAYCMSRMFRRCNQLLRNLRISELSFDEYMKLVMSKQITCVADVIDIISCADRIECTPAQLLRAVIPTEICPSAELLSLICNRCANNWKSIEYYLDNPAKLFRDLNISSVFQSRMCQWLADPYNLLEIKSVSSNPKIIMNDIGKLFSGAPIFRNRRIAVTGTFVHGSLDKIRSILMSYSADISTDIEGDCVCLLVGDIPENIDATLIGRARAINIPVYSESAFFANYEIDEDIRQNLLYQ